MMDSIMKKNILLAAAAVTFAISASAQNLNPTVEVTNDFLGKTVDASKPLGKMEVPDSVMKFDLDFDYSVLSSPYKGGYDFSPYLLEMKPAADAYKAGKFYLRAGAGYTLNPEFDLVWSPKLKNQALHLNVFAQNRSYVGDYRTIRPEEQVGEDGVGTGAFTFAPASVTGEDGKTSALKYAGYDLHSVAGVNGKYDFARSFMDFGLSYEGIHVKTFLSDCVAGPATYSSIENTSKGNYNAVEAKAGIHSNDDRENAFRYDADFSYRYSVSDETFGLIWKSLRSNDVALKGELGPVFDETHAVLVGVGMSLSTYAAPLLYRNDYDIYSQGTMHSQAGHLYVAPHYVLSSYRMKLSAGVKLDMVIASSNEFVGSLPINQNKGQLIYPDVRFDYQLIREYLDAYASVTGGVDHNSYTSLKQDDHFYEASFSAALVNPLSMNTIERFNARIGVRGNVASVFRYDLSGGFASYGSYRHSVVGLDIYTPKFYSRPLLTGMGTIYGYDDANVAYASFKGVLDLGGLLVDGSLTYTHTNLLKKEVPGFSPSPLVGNISVSYNWKDRISAGIHADGALKREGIWGYNIDYIPEIESISTFNATIPGFVNLGIDASYAFNRKLSFWLKGDNLLCQCIQRTPLYAEKGIKFTAGICLNL